MKIEGVKCLRYHRGIDGEGTCDTECQWFVEGYACPFWISEEEWKRDRELWREGMTIEEFEKRYGKKIRIDKETCEKLEKQVGEILPELVERFLVLRNWKPICPPDEYWEFAYKPDATYCAELIRDLAVEIIKIKNRLDKLEKVREK